MPLRPATVVVREQADQPTDWRRFVAILCFIEFYSQFVLHGQRVGLFLREHGSREPLDDASFYFLLHGAAGILRSVMLYNYGRALWFNSRSARRWLLRAVAVSLGMIAIGMVNAFTESTPREYYWHWNSQFDSSETNSRPFIGVLRNVDHLPWLLMLIAGLAVLRYRACASRRLAPWLVIAAAWCMGVMLLPLAANSTCRGYWIHESALANHLALSYACLHIMVAASLLWRWKSARTGPLLLAATEISLTMLFADRWRMMLWSSIQMELLKVGVTVSYWSPIFFWNRDTFRWVFVELPANAGPWLLLAFYVWRVEMNKLGDDGSPYPRTYCGRCGYNLHGISSDRCPECGASSGRRPDWNVEPAGAPERK